ncbi:hypothetical protein BV902_13100 [Sphingobacterium sp. B29]|nr:hypothetical protein BV902_13100 [Sphingobacterium sp. B29]
MFFLKKNNCTIKLADGNDSNVIHDILDTFALNCSLESIRILIDYSSMTRVWYGEILSYFRDTPHNFTEVEITFAYSFAKFVSPPSENYRNLYVSPIDGFSYFSIPDKPTAVLIGLGYEKNKAFGLSEYFDGETFVFYNDDAIDNRFNTSIETINQSLLEVIAEENKFSFPIYDLEFSERQLLSLCSYLQNEYRIIIAPTGPKPFTLISLIISLKIREIDVWRISQGDNRKAIPFQAEGKLSLYKVKFVYHERNLQE